MTDLSSIARQALGLMDLTSLNEDDTESKITDLCLRSRTAVGDTAAICIYPRFIQHAREMLSKQGRGDFLIATVTNFPSGGADIFNAVLETKTAVSAGADEVDVVYPYQQLINGNAEVGKNLVAECKQACGNRARLKVIIETGVLSTDELIHQASVDCIRSGADFIKTSTGKVAVNATPNAARIMLEAIKALDVSVGFKPAGGMKTTEDAAVYIRLAEEILGRDWVNPTNFRLGASSLLADLLNTLGVENNLDTGGY